jgi:hypothetical protein
MPMLRHVKVRFRIIALAVLAAVLISVTSVVLRHSAFGSGQTEQDQKPVWKTRYCIVTSTESC